MTPAALPNVALAVRPTRKAGAVEQGILAVVDGGANITGSLAGAVVRAGDHLQTNASQPQVPVPKLAVKPTIMGRVWNALTSPTADLKQQALNNSRQHSGQILNALPSVLPAARKIANDAAHTSAAVIRPQLSAPALVAADVTASLPSLLLSGPQRAKVVANRVQQAVSDYGQNQSIPGAFSQLLIPGNSMLANLAQPYLTQKLTRATR